MAGLMDFNMSDIQAYLDSRTASNKAKYAPLIAAAGLNPDTYDYANLQPEILDKVLATPGADPKQALQMSTMDYSGNGRLQDFDAYTGAAGKVASGALAGDQLWTDYDKNAYKQSDFQNLMKTGIKGGLIAMGGAAGADAMGYGNLAGTETAALAPGQVGAMTAPAGGGSITGGLWANPVPGSLGAVGAGDLTLAASGGLEGLGAMAAGAGGVVGANGVIDIGALTDSIGAQAAVPVEIGSAATNAATAYGAPMATAAGLNGTAITAGGGGLLGTIGGALKPVTTAIKGINDLTGGNLGAIIGGLAGAAASGDTTTSSSKDPWAPAQPYLKDNLATNAAMQKYYQANPFSEEQKQAYQGLLNTNANGLSNAGNFNKIAQNFMGSNRGLLGQMPTLNTGVTAPQVDWTKYANIGKGG